MRRISGRNQAIYEGGKVASVLASAGIKVVSEVPSDYIIYCPFHDNHRTPAGEVSKETGVFYCFSCHKSCTLEELVMRTTGRSYFQVLRMIDTGVVSLDNILDTRSKPHLVEFPQGDIDRLHAGLNERATRYLLNRGIYALDEFEIGYSQLRDMTTVPVHSPSGMPVGFVGRSIEGKDFKNSHGLPKREILFNLHRVRSHQHVYVLESVFDTIRCHQIGIPAVSTLGSNVTKEQLRLIFKYFSEVYVVPDRDEAGKRMALTMMDRGAILVAVPEGAKDVGDLTDERIKALLDRSNPVAGIL